MLAALRTEEALDLTQEFLAFWFIHPQGRLISHFSDWVMCELSPNLSRGKEKREEQRMKARK